MAPRRPTSGSPRSPRPSFRGPETAQSDATAERDVRSHPGLSATRLPAGGFQMMTDDETEQIRVVPDGRGFCVEGTRALEGARLTRDAACGGLVLQAVAPAVELGRSTPALDASDPSRSRHLLLADGRLFRLGPAAGRGSGWIVTGWETPGAYVILDRRDTGRFDLEPTPAAGGLADLGALCLLAAAEAFDAFGELGREDDVGAS